MRKDKLKVFYNNVLCQTLSSNGDILFAGNTFGDIFVKGIAHFHSEDNNMVGDIIYPQGNVSINCLWYHNDTLIVGTRGCIYGLKWDKKTSTLRSTKCWELLIPHSPDINCFFMETDSNVFLVGCDDGKIHLVDLENVAITGCFKEHKSSVYCMTSCKGNIYSSGHDGKILMWSLNEKKSFHKIEPFKLKGVARPDFGNFIASCDVAGDWLICGGGTKLILWSLRTDDLVHIFDFPGKIFCANFLEDDTSIFVAGTHTHVHVYHLNGTTASEIPVNNTSIWSAALNKTTEFLSFAGYDNRISVISNYRFLNSQMTLYKTV